MFYLWIWKLSYKGPVSYLRSVCVLWVYVDVYLLALRQTVLVDAVVPIAHVLVGLGVDRSPGTSTGLLQVVVVTVPVGEGLGANGASVRRTPEPFLSLSGSPRLAAGGPHL